MGREDDTKLEREKSKTTRGRPRDDVKERTEEFNVQF